MNYGNDEGMGHRLFGEASCGKLAGRVNRRHRAKPQTFAGSPHVTEQLGTIKKHGTGI